MQHLLEYAAGQVPHLETVPVSQMDLLDLALLVEFKYQNLFNRGYDFGHLHASVDSALATLRNREFARFHKVNEAIRSLAIKKVAKYEQFELVLKEKDPVAFANGLKELSTTDTMVGFYSCLMLARAYKHGQGVTDSLPNSFKYLYKAMQIARKLESNISLIEICKIPGLILTVTKTVCSNPEAFGDAATPFPCLIALCKEFWIDYLSSYATPTEQSSTVCEQYLALVEELKKFPKEFLNEDMVELGKRLQRKRIDLKLKRYLAHLEAHRQPKFNGTNWSADQEIIKTSREIVEDPFLHDAAHQNSPYFSHICPHILAHAEMYYANKSPQLQFASDDARYNVNHLSMATKWFLLHFKLTRSPKTALKLGHMAAKGEFMEQKRERTPLEQLSLKSDFSKAVEFYENAIDEGFRQIDFVTAHDAIQAYQKSVDEIPAQSRLDIPAKIQRCIKDLENVPPKSAIDALLSLSINIKNYSFREMIPACVKRVTEVLRSKEALSKDDKSVYALGEIANAVNIFLQSGSDKELFKELYEAINHLIAQRTKNALLTKDFESLYHFRRIIFRIEHLVSDVEEAKELINLFKVSLADISYWEQRFKLEDDYIANKTEASSEKLPNIYHLAHREKNNIKGMFKADPITELKKQAHSEGYLKIAELLLSKVPYQPSQGIVRAVGANIIRAMTAKSPNDPLGIYKDLGLRTISSYTLLIKNEEKYAEFKHLAHFYEALSLLITDKNKFHADNVSLFEGKDHSQTADSALNLVSDLELNIDDDVKRFVLEKIVELGKMKLVDNKVAQQAREQLVKLPPTEKANAVILNAEVAFPPIPIPLNTVTPTVTVPASLSNPEQAPTLPTVLPGDHEIRPPYNPLYSPGKIYPEATKSAEVDGASYDQSQLIQDQQRQIHELQLKVAEQARELQAARDTISRLQGNELMFLASKKEPAPAAEVSDEELTARITELKLQRKEMARKKEAESKTPIASATKHKEYA